MSDTDTPRLSIIVTTSVTRSNPDTAVIRRIFEALGSVVRAMRADVVVVYDGVMERAGETRFKSGRVSCEERVRYEGFRVDSQRWIRAWHSCLNKCDDGYVENVEECVLDEHAVPVSVVVKTVHAARRNDGLYMPKLTFVEASTRLGFAFAIKTALMYVTTPYCLVNQHDWEFDVCDIDFDVLLDTMDMKKIVSGGERVMRYVGFTAVANKGFLVNQWSNRGLPGVQCEGDVKLASTRCCETCQAGSCIPDLSLDQLSLTESASSKSLPHVFKFNGQQFLRCHFWYDKPHLVSTATYTQIFSENLLHRGDFIEDVYGQHMVHEIKKGEMKGKGGEACEKFGCWVLWDGGCRLKHLNGRGFLTEAMRGVVKSEGWVNKRAARREKKFGIVAPDARLVLDGIDDCGNEEEVYLDMF